MSSIPDEDRSVTVADAEPILRGCYRHIMDLRSAMGDAVVKQSVQTIRACFLMTDGVTQQMTDKLQRQFQDTLAGENAKMDNFVERTMGKEWYEKRYLRR